MLESRADAGQRGSAAIRTGRLVDVEAGAALADAWPMIYLDQTDSRLPGTCAAGNLR